MQRALEHRGAIALAVPEGDRFADPHPPPFDVLGDDAGDVGEEAEVLAAHRLGWRWRPPRWRRLAEDDAHLVGADRAAELLHRDHPVERTLQLADVGELGLRQLIENVRPERDFALLALVAEDRRPGLVVRRTDIDDQAPGQPRDQPLIDVGDLVRRAVAGHHDLAAAPLQRVEQPQHLGLGLAPPGEELQVVDQQHVDVLVALRKTQRLPDRDRRVQLLDEFVERDVLGLQRRLQAPRIIADRRREVRLAEARRAIDEERVIGRARRFGNGARRRDSEPVGGADDEVFKTEPRVRLH